MQRGAAATVSQGVGADPLLSSFFTQQNSQSAANRPKAYLNVLFFDEQFKADIAASRTQQVGTGFMNSNNPGQLGFVAGSAALAQKSGYCYIYISNESDDLVYFDNFTLSHEKSSLIEETHYYPFGLTMAGISSKAAGKLENRFKFNEGTELNSDFDLSLYETPHRGYDPQIGRFWQIDEFGEVFEEWSPYVFGFNNPIEYNDPDGLQPFGQGKKELPKDPPPGSEPTTGAGAVCIGIKKTGSVYHGLNIYHTMMNRTGGNLGLIENDQFRNEMYRYQQLAQYRERVNEMTRQSDVVALEVGGFFVPMGWLTKISKLRYLQKFYLLKRGQAAGNIGKVVSLTDDGAKVAVNAVDDGAKVAVNAVDDAAKGVTNAVTKSESVLGHIFRNAPGHVNPSTVASQNRYIKLFENVANNPANLNQSILAPNAIKNGVQGFTQTFQNGQIWVQTRNGRIFDAGVNLIPK